MQNKNIDMEMKNSKLRIIDTKVYERMLEKQSDRIWLSQTALSLPPSLFYKLTLETPKSKVCFSWKPVLDKKKVKNANRF